LGFELKISPRRARSSRRIHPSSSVFAVLSVVKSF
jgi:hypothetical protein